MDIIRTIVLAVRDADEPINGVENIESEQFAFHAQLLEEAGLVMVALSDGPKIVAEEAVIYRLTWEGHDFADSIADETIWNKAKQHLLGPSAAWSFAILREVVSAVIKERLDI